MPVLSSPPASSEADPATLPDLPGITLAPKPLNRGPLAAIYRGWDRVHRCDVIVKVQRATGDPIAAERFRREAAVMKRLRHPNIVAMYQFHDGDPAALVLEYVAGRTLANLVEADGWLSPLRTAQIMEDVAAALDCAHVQSVIHRDVKPSNILLPGHGAARLYDFGVAHIDEDTPLTVMGDILGTIEYASPEQVHGNETPDARSDVYSLAAVAYFALTGTPPFRAADNSTQAQLSVMHRQVFAEPPPLRFHREDLTAEIEAAVLRGLAKAPASRYASAGQFAAALRTAVEAGDGVPEQRAMAAASRRNGVLAGALAGATLFLLGVLALWRTGQFPASHPESSHVAQGTKVTPKVPSSSRPVAVVPTPVVTGPAMTGPVAPPAVVPQPVKPPVAVVRAPTPPPVAVVPEPVATSPGPVVPSRPASRSVKRPVSVVKAPAPHPTAVKPGHPAASVVANRPQTLPVKSASRSTAGPPMVPHRGVGLAPAVRPKPLLTRKPPLAAQAGRPKTVAQRAWLYVYAYQNVAPLGPKERMANIGAESVWVDGYRASDLAGGHWTSLPPGRHLVSFVPDPKSGFGPHKNVAVMLAPGARVRKQILLPALVGSPALQTAALPSPHPSPKPPVSVPPAASKPRPVGWYSVSGWVPGSLAGHKSSLVRASAQWVKVDGQPVPQLAVGGWAQLSAGRHVVVFQPTPALGIGPKTWNINLPAQAHLSQRIPFVAPAPQLALHSAKPMKAVGHLSVSGWLPVTVPGEKRQLLPVAASAVTIDGRPSPDLAHGRWISLPAGRHVVVFHPVPGSGASPVTRVISVSPRAHLNQLLPLPSAPLPAIPVHLRNP